MKAYFDTNVLIAAFIQEHPHHAQSFRLVEKVVNGTLQGYSSAHTLAEFFSVVTRAPFRPRVQPGEAGRYLEENIVPNFDLVALSSEDYRDLLRIWIDTGLAGGIVYDALHLKCAQKSGCDRIYTWNAADFQGLAPHLRAKIFTP